MDHGQGVSDPFGSTIPIDHGQDVGDPFGSTPPHHLLDDHILEQEEVPHVSTEREDQPPSLPCLTIEALLDHPSSSATYQVATTTSIV